MHAVPSEATQKPGVHVSGVTVGSEEGGTTGWDDGLGLGLPDGAGEGGTIGIAVGWGVGPGVGTAKHVVAPMFDDFPVGHDVHEDAPVEGWYDPTSQLMQSSALVAPVTEQ